MSACDWFRNPVDPWAEIKAWWKKAQEESGWVLDSDELTLADAIAQLQAAPTAESLVTLARLLGEELEMDPLELVILSQAEHRQRSRP